MIKKVLLCFLLLFLFVDQTNAQAQKNHWVDSVFSTMLLDEKIGQLFMVPVNSSKDERYINVAEEEIKNRHVGGIIFTSGNPLRQASVTNNLQKISSIPLLIGLNGSTGLGTTLDSTITFPAAPVLGAIRNDSLIYAAAKEIAREMKMMGVHINFAPDVALNANSFGTNKNRVASKSIAFMRGLQNNGILACAKNFTLNGITVSGMQKGLPIVKSFTDSVTRYLFKELIDKGVSGIMPAKTGLPVFYEQKNFVKKNKLSTQVMTAVYAGDNLKQMNFNGLMFVDISTLKKEKNKLRAGDLELISFQTGNDVLVSPEDIGPAIRKIKKLLKKQKQYIAQLDNSVKKILAAKYDAGLHKRTSIYMDNLITKLNTPEAKLLNQKLQENAITIITNSNNTLPIATLDNKNFAYLSIDGKSSNNEFYHYLKKYIAPARFIVDEKTNADDLIKSLENQHVIIAGISPQTPEVIVQKLLPILKKLQSSHEIIVCDFGYPRLINQADNFSNFITTYNASPDMQKLMPQVIFGALNANGQLPFAASSNLPEGVGIQTQSIKRFTYSLPEDAHMDSEKLEAIDQIANEAIKSGATPGCHVLVAREGKVIYEKSFGYLTYDNKTPVTDETIYDLASVTKVSATLQAVMFLYEKGMIDINKKASVYLPELKGSNKSDFTLKDILTHQAGLWPFLPFWAQTIKQNQYLPEFYSRKKSDQFPLMVADSLYAPVSIRDSLWNWIIKSKIREKPTRTPFDYKYSDMGFYILQHLAEKILNQPIEDFIQQNLYEPLGSSTTGYLPLQRFIFSQIAPTENDKLFRKSLLTGTVHDQGAAMLGGVAGHAGLFSNANDLAKLGQMLLQQGSYGGYQYYKPETVQTFTQKQFVTSNRGLGWDRPTGVPNGPTSLFASQKTFGHTGFTGTCIWVDPEFNLVYIFLSNRVHPDMTNNKLINANIRPRIHEVIYQSIFKYCEKSPLIN